jgi:hypothetical protein
MKRFSKALMLVGIAALAGVAFAGSAMAQSNDNNGRATPKGWNYEIKDGKRVPKGGNRVTNSDGSWREETRQGACVTVKEKTATGEYKESRRCD